jgi:hypothetical protein
MGTTRSKRRWKHEYAAVLKDLAQPALRRNREFEEVEFRLMLNLLTQPDVGPQAVASAIDDFVEARRQAYPTAGMDDSSLSGMLVEHVSRVYETLRVHPPQVVEAVLRDILRAFREADRAVEASLDRREQIRAMFCALDSRTRCVVAAVVKLYRMRFEEGPDFVQDLEREFADKDPEGLVALCCGAAEMQSWLWLLRMCDAVHKAGRLGE